MASNTTSTLTLGAGTGKTLTFLCGCRRLYTGESTRAVIGLTPDTAISDAAFLSKASDTFNDEWAKTTPIIQGGKGVPLLNFLMLGRENRWWNPDAPSFRLAAMRIAVVEVEQRALSISADMPSTDPLPFYSSDPVSAMREALSAVSTVHEAVEATLATYCRNDPLLPEPGRNYVMDSRFTVAAHTGSTFRENYETAGDVAGRITHNKYLVEAPAGIGKSTLLDLMVAAFSRAYDETRRAMRRALRVFWVAGYLSTSTPRHRQLDAERQTRTRLRNNRFRRFSGIHCPGQVVISSPCVCRGPNSAGDQSIRNRLRSASTP
ncbi:hypothetical protein [Nocardia sp. XZ_19_385]|uniref:hypothetical protein n=1 Tax=Nocardia sp. XZ_19_385 TaxID=2769488 RepID=UPI0018908AF1|nr:hypothetical protein [Nocardia sp. XZ_19_385]